MKKIFNITTAISNKLLTIEKNKNFKKWESYMWILCFFVAGYICDENIFIASVLLVICFMIQIVGCLDETLNSIKGFMSKGIMHWSLVTIFLIIILDDFGKTIVLPYIISTLTWCFYSLLANNKVASIVNQIVSAVFAVIVLLKDMILSLIPEKVLNKMLTSGYTVGAEIEAVFNLIFTPILITNLIAMTLCMLKGYWIEKYNDNNDVGADGMDVKHEMEMLKEQNKLMSEKVEQLTEQINQLMKKIEANN